MLTICAQNIILYEAGFIGIVELYCKLNNNLKSSV